MRETFTKAERLYHKKLIQQLYAGGSRFSIPPFRIRWLLVAPENPAPARLLISVPRAALPGAVNRNLIKRRIREAYRRHKSHLYTALKASPYQLLIGITYSSQTLIPTPGIQEKIIVILHRLTKEVEKAAG
jgi:ribonuclease P protein component